MSAPPAERAAARVIAAAYAWRYAVVIPGADVAAAERDLQEAVDEWDVENTAEADAMTDAIRQAIAPSPPPGVCNHPRLVPRYPCAACAPKPTDGKWRW